jgi:hypothetical protein
MDEHELREVIRKKEEKIAILQFEVRMLTMGLKA